MQTPMLSRSRLWLLGVTAVVVVAATLLPLRAPVGAQEVTPDDPRVIDPADPCHVAAPPAPFSDRDQTAEVHRLSVDCAFATGITHGAGQGDRYDPRLAVRRDQMASFIVRTLQAAGGIEIPSPTDQGFTDVSGNTHEDAINQLAALGITQGRTATRYAPAELVRRDQMASFIMRGANVAFDTTFDAVDGPYFADVPPTNVHSVNIDAGFELFGLTIGQADNVFAPDRSVRRDQMATFLIRLLDITVLTDDAAPLDQGVVDELTGDVVPDDITGVVEDVGDIVDDVTDVVGDVELPVDVIDVPDAVTGSPDEDGNLLERVLP